MQLRPSQLLSDVLMLQRDKLYFRRCSSKEFLQLVRNGLLLEVQLIVMKSSSSDLVIQGHANGMNLAVALAKTGVSIGDSYDE